MAQPKHPPGEPMDLAMCEEWLSPLCAWANDNACVRELWLFGSRAKGCSTPDSDVDLAIVLTPKGKDNWALAKYSRFGDDWQRGGDAQSASSLLSPDRLNRTRAWGRIPRCATGALPPFPLIRSRANTLTSDKVTRANVCL